MVTLAATERTNPRKLVEYSSRVARCAPDASPSSTCSAWRFPATMNSDAAPATMRNQSEIWTFVATPPATARRTNPAATAPRSTTGSCLSQMLYETVSAT